MRKNQKDNISAKKPTKIQSNTEDTENRMPWA